MSSLETMGTPPFSQTFLGAVTATIVATIIGGIVMLYLNPVVSSRLAVAPPASSETVQGGALTREPPGSKVSAPSSSATESPSRQVATLGPAETKPVISAGEGVAAATVETTTNLYGARWALRQDEIQNDSDGQWASEATASSSYNNGFPGGAPDRLKGTAGWSAWQATGVPNVEEYRDSGKAWTPATPDSGVEWLDLKYDKAVHASEVRIRESLGSGAVIKVELFDEAGTPHLTWSGNDPTRGLNYLIIKFKPTEYRSNRCKVTLATNVIPGWNEIDAVQLVGKP
jgi:hypothetical protein